MKNSEINSSVAKQSNKKLVKKKNQSSTTFNSNLDFIEQHQKLFKTISIYENSDLFFKNSLRSYDYIKFKTRPSNNHKVSNTDAKQKSIRSSTTFKEKTKPIENKTKKRLQKSRFTESKRESIKVILPPYEFNQQFENFNIETEEDDEIFYSPYSGTARSSKNLIASKQILDKMTEETSEMQEQQEDEVPVNDQPTNEDSPIKKQDDAENDTAPADEQNNDGGEIVDEAAAVTDENAANEETSADKTDEGGADADATDDVPASEGTEEDLNEIREMIKEASKELESVALEDNGDVLPETAKVEEGGSVFKFNAANDAALLQELEDAERQAKETSTKITALRERLIELVKKEQCTEIEANELEQLNKELKIQMNLFDEKTKRIQFLLEQANLFENMIRPQPMLQIKRAEDALPKVIVCGLTEANIPKLIVCDDMKKKKKQRKYSPRSDVEDSLPIATVPKYDNYNLDSRRCHLRSDLGSKDQNIEHLQRKLFTIQNEMRNICIENAALQTKIEEVYRKQNLQQQSCGRNQSICPAEAQFRLKEYSERKTVLERQLCNVEREMGNLQNELCAIQCERQQMERSGQVGRQIAICSPRSPPPPKSLTCGPPPAQLCSPPCDPQLRELKEQYNRLQDDYKSKLTEVAGLRADNERLKENNIESVNNTVQPKNFSIGNKEQLVEMEQQMNVAKQRFREAQDELEELRAFVQDQEAQMNEYRNKYLEAQQIVEEQERHIHMMEMESLRINEEINLDIQQIKNQFQQKLEELSPLPDLLKTTQNKLQETQQMYLATERDNEILQRDLQIYKDKVEQITNDLERSQAGDASSQYNYDQLLNENDYLRNESEKKTHEIAQLVAQLDNVREESARQVSRTKDRCEIVRRSMQNQISDLERQLAQSRAQTKIIQKERDEIRRKMQEQVNNLYQNFQDAEIRIKSLQGHMEFLKGSYNTAALPYNGGDLNYSESCDCGVQFKQQ